MFFVHCYKKGSVSRIKVCQWYMLLYICSQQLANSSLRKTRLLYFLMFFRAHVTIKYLPSNSLLPNFIRSSKICLKSNRSRGEQKLKANHLASGWMFTLPGLAFLCCTKFTSTTFHAVKICHGHLVGLLEWSKSTGSKICLVRICNN